MLLFTYSINKTVCTSIIALGSYVKIVKARVYTVYDPK